MHWNTQSVLSCKKVGPSDTASSQCNVWQFSKVTWRWQHLHAKRMIHELATGNLHGLMFASLNGRVHAPLKASAATSASGTPAQVTYNCISTKGHTCKETKCRDDATEASASGTLAFCVSVLAAMVYNCLCILGLTCCCSAVNTQQHTQLRCSLHTTLYL